MSERAKRTSTLPAWIMGGAILLPVLYVGSYMIIAVLHYRGYLPPSLIGPLTVIYWPMDWAIMMSPQSMKAWAWFLSLWN